MTDLTVLCDLHEIASNTTDEQTKTQLLNLWKNLCHINRAKEVLHVGSLHSEETLKDAKDLLNKLSSVETLKDNIIGA
jgi:hypothetical protein